MGEKLPECHRDGCNNTVTQVAYENEYPAFYTSMCCRIHHQTPGWEAYVQSQHNSDLSTGGVRKSQKSDYAKKGA